MCGIVAILSDEPVNQALYNALTVVQHRGQDAAGIMTSDMNRVYLRKDNGLVRDVFHTRHMVQLQGNVGIGHTRYPTAGCDSRAEAQPFYVNSPFGIALAHNGNLTNSEQLRSDLFKQDLRQLNTTSDSEILLNVFAHELREQMGKGNLHATPEHIFASMKEVFRRCEGAYAAVLMIVGVGIVAFRDRCGIRPIVYGTKKDNQSVSHMFASESVALDVSGYDLVRDVSAGEVIFVDAKGQVHAEKCDSSGKSAPCVFEYVYLARPDSIIDDIPVYRTRMRMGEKLAEKLLRIWPDHDIDTIIPVPDTSRTSALELAKNLKIPYREGFIKNRYIGRTFIMPGQSERKDSVRQKLNPIRSEFENKNVLLVDDSVVRGTTSKQIIQLAREAGAKKVYFASAAPPVRFANVYGIDLPSTEELVAHNRTVDEITEKIGADWLLYQDIEDLYKAVSEGSNLTDFDMSCFNGEYVTGDISEEYLARIDIERNDSAKEKKADNLDLSDVMEITAQSG